MTRSSPLMLLVVPALLMWSATTRAAEPQVLVPADADDPDTSHFGESVQVRGDTLVAGAPNASSDGSLFEGAAYVFSRDGDEWVETARLSASAGGANDRFGSAVAVGNDLVVIGAPNVSVDGITEAGAVYVFERDEANAWMQTARLVAEDPTSLAHFGSSLDVYEGRVLVAAPDADRELGGRFGAAYLFERSGGSWQQLEKFAGDDDAQRFASSVAIDGDMIAVAHFDNGVYLYREDGGWSEQAFLPLEAGSGELNLAMEDDVLAVGSPLATPGSTGDVFGAVHVYERVNNTWQRTASLRSTSSAGQIGRSIDLNDGQLVAASGHEAGGDVHLLRRDEAGEWMSSASVSFPDPGAGLVASVTADTLAIGRRAGEGGSVQVHDATALVSEGDMNGDGPGGNIDFEVVAGGGTDEGAEDDADPVQDDPGDIDDTDLADTIGITDVTDDTDIDDLGDSSDDPAGVDDDAAAGAGTASADIETPDRQVGEGGGGAAGGLLALMVLFAVRWRPAMYRGWKAAPTLR